jgi:hypothetical protein
MDVQMVFLPVDLLFCFQQYPHDLAPISVELSHVCTVIWRIGGNPRPVLRWSGIYQVL